MENLAVICVIMTLAMCESASADTVPRPHRFRHERSHRRFQHLQDLIDRLDLRQKTDHIRITNLQRAIREIQGREAWRPADDFEWVNWKEKTAKEKEKDAWKPVYDFEWGKNSKEDHDNLQETQKEVRNTSPSGTTHIKKSRTSDAERQKESDVNDQERRDELLLLRQEVAALRSEVKVLKEQRAAEWQGRSAHSIQQEQREALTATWVMDNVRRLQEAVEELQEAMNVTTALHDKQEVESRLSVVSKDLGAFRSSLSAITSKAEAAAATVETMREELVRTAEDANLARGKVEALGLEVSGIKEEFNSLLATLPDGVTVKGSNATHKRLDPRTNESNPTSSEAWKQQPLQPAAVNHQLQERVRATESGLGEVKASSIQLLDALESLEAQTDTGIAEVRQEVAKLEYRMAAMQESATVPGNRSDMALMNHVNQLEVKVLALESANSQVPNITSDIKKLTGQIDKLEHRLTTIPDSDTILVPNTKSASDFKALTNQIDQLALFLASVDNQSISECRSTQLALNHRLNEALRRIEALERGLKKS